MFKGILSIWIWAVIVVSGSAAVMEDSFDLHAQPSGTKLNGTTPPNSTAKWQCFNHVVINSDAGQGYVTSSSEVPILAKLPLQAGAEKITLEAVVCPLKKKSWLGIGLGNPASGTDFLWSQGLLLLIHESGAVEIFYNPERRTNADASALTPIKRKITERISIPEGGVRLKMEYDRSRNAVSMWANDRLILEDHVLENFSPNPLYAGFSGYNATAELSRVDYFKVETSP